MGRQLTLSSLLVAALPVGRNCVVAAVKVSAVSARDAWAVGATRTTFAVACRESTAHSRMPGAGARLAVPLGLAATKSKPVILHWNGAKWMPATIPALRDGAVLSGVATITARKAWAVGGLDYLQPKGKVLVLRWNGSAWK